MRSLMDAAERIETRLIRSGAPMQLFYFALILLAANGTGNLA
jgi:hypothetical protein